MQMIKTVKFSKNIRTELFKGLDHCDGRFFKVIFRN